MDRAAGLPVRMRVIDFPMTAMKDWRAPVAPRADRVAARSRCRARSGSWTARRSSGSRCCARLTRTRRRPTAERTSRTSDLREFLRRAFDAKEQPLLHVVGDGAIAMALDASRTPAARAG